MNQMYWLVSIERDTKGAHRGWQNCMMPSRPGSRRINRSPSPHLIFRRGGGCRSAIRDRARIHGKRSLRNSWPRYFTHTLKIFSPSSRACLPRRTTHRTALIQEPASSIAYCLLPTLHVHSPLASTRILRQEFSLPSPANNPRMLRWTNDAPLLLQATEDLIPHGLLEEGHITVAFLACLVTKLSRTAPFINDVLVEW